MFNVSMSYPLVLIHRMYNDDKCLLIYAMHFICDSVEIQLQIDR
jgi:hypothetical protein